MYDKVSKLTEIMSFAKKTWLTCQNLTSDSKRLKCLNLREVSSARVETLQKPRR